VIRVERSIPGPRSLLGARAESARAEALGWAERQGKSRAGKVAQQAFHPRDDVLWEPEVVDALLDLFGKCAFCESPTHHPELVGCYRPPSGAVDLRGDASLVHYAWLAYDWENLYLVCTRCARARGRRFPIEGRRAAVGARGEQLTAERPLLLDPCADNPDEHLVFLDDGRVASETHRGRRTIETFDLNRGDLVEARRAAATDAADEWRQGLLGLAMDERAHYAGARRQAVRRLAERAATGETAGPIENAIPAEKSGQPTIVDTGDHLVIGGVRLKKRTAEQEHLADRDESESHIRQSAYSLEDAATEADYFRTARFIRRFEIRNFRPIAALTVEMPEIGTEACPWLCLLGENGAGKSSVVQAVALTLMGGRARSSLGLDARRYVRHGARQGSVRVWLTGVDDPLTLAFSKDDPDFGGTPDPKVLLLAYGSTRLLPRDSSELAPGEVARVSNLFNPFAPLANASAWLLALDDKSFAAAARGLRGLLGLEGEDVIQRHRATNEIRCRTLGASVRLEEMSDGYQSVVALAADIMSVLLGLWSDLAAAEGVVLIDELGAHLHPRWRMRIVGRLRALFPRVQFLVTTHDPLCLRGLRDGEVAVVERLLDKARTVVVKRDLPPVGGMRTDQLLTSELFGLRSTIDPELEAEFDEYFALKAVRSPTPIQEQRLAQLTDRLEPLRVLGDTPRERLALEAADRFLTEQKQTKGDLARAELKEGTLQELRDIWAAAAPERFD